MADPAAIAISPTEPVFDGEWRLLEWIPSLGLTTWFLLTADGEVVIRTDSEVGALLDFNADQRADNAGKRWGDGRKVASVPVQLWMRELAEATQQDDRRYIAKWLNDSDRRNLRTFEGQV